MIRSPTIFGSPSYYTKSSSFVAHTVHETKNPAYLCPNCWSNHQTLETQGEYTHVVCKKCGFNTNVSLGEPYGPSGLDSIVVCPTEDGREEIISGQMYLVRKIYSALSELKALSETLNKKQVYSGTDSGNNLLITRCTSDILDAKKVL